MSSTPSVKVDPVDLQTFMASLRHELVRARELFGPFHSMHEGLAVLEEEVDEAKRIVRNRMRGKEASAALLHECVQVAAMAFYLWADTQSEEAPRQYDHLRMPT